MRRSLLPGEETNLGDKGGKKDKNKSQKQMAEKRDHKAKQKRDKQPPSTS
jgi:hypothetical protein